MICYWKRNFSEKRPQKFRVNTEQILCWIYVQVVYPEEELGGVQHAEVGAASLAPGGGVGKMEVLNAQVDPGGLATGTHTLTTGAHGDLCVVTLPQTLDMRPGDVTYATADQLHQTHAQDYSQARSFFLFICLESTQCVSFCRTWTSATCPWIRNTTWPIQKTSLCM